MPLAVARKVGRKEVESVPEARAAVDKEYDKLLNAPHPDGKGKGVWDMDSVKEKKTVKQEAERLGLTVFFALLAELCFQKGSELVAGDPGQVYKGRHVLLGDQVKDGQFDAAQFQDLGSAPPTMMAAKVVDAWSLQVGYILSQSDAASAYTQEFIGGGRGLGSANLDESSRTQVAPSMERQVLPPGCLANLGTLRSPRCRGILGAKVRKCLERVWMGEDLLARSVHSPADEFLVDCLRR